MTTSKGHPRMFSSRSPHRANGSQPQQHDEFVVVNGRSSDEFMITSVRREVRR
jgi:hypothetical protein